MTAYRAWDRVQGWFGWVELPRDAARDLGVVIRRLRPGERHGRFLALDDDAAEVARRVAGRLGIERAGGVLGEPMRIETTRPNPKALCCPWHPDRHPSLGLHPSASDGQGVIVTRRVSPTRASQSGTATAVCSARSRVQIAGRPVSLRSSPRRSGAEVARSRAAI